MKLTPTSAEELAEAVRGLSAPVRIEGGGTRRAAAKGDVLSLSALSGVVDYEPGALTLIAKAGTPLDEIETLLAQENQRLAFEPMDHRALMGTLGAPTIGGVIGGNVSGPRSIAVGAARDFALGVKFVDGAGRLLQNGGRVMKNVTGYDLVKLMCGSAGTLGALHEVSLKTLPKPETETTLAFAAESATRALDLMSGALGSPFEVTGAAYEPLARRVLLRIEGFEASVAYRAAELQKKLGAADLLDASQSAEAWAALRDLRSFAGRPFVVRASIRPSHLPMLAERLGQDWIADWGGGLVWAAAEAGDALGLGQRLRAFVADHGGHVTFVKAPEAVLAEVPAAQPQPEGIARLSQGLRARFDPKGLFV